MAIRASGQAQGPGLRRDDECFECISFFPGHQSANAGIHCHEWAPASAGV